MLDRTVFEVQRCRNFTTFKTLETAFGKREGLLLNLFSVKFQFLEETRNARYDTRRRGVVQLKVCRDTAWITVAEYFHGTNKK